MNATAALLCAAGLASAQRIDPAQYLERVYANVVAEDGSKLPAPPAISSLCPFASTMGYSTIVLAFIPEEGNYAYVRAGRCEVIISLAGYRTLRTSVHTNGQTIRLQRLGEKEGSTISFTTLEAPPRARKSYEKGTLAAYRKKWDEAVRHFKEAVREYRLHAGAWHELGDVYEHLGRSDDAVRAWERALEADPRFLKPALRLIAVALVNQRWDDAFARTTRLLELNPIEFPIAFYYRAVAAKALGNDAIAAEAMKRYRQLEPASEPQS